MWLNRGRQNATLPLMTRSLILGLDTIGQAFADEVFRVFANEHPDMQLYVTGANPAVQHMIRHVAGDRTGAILGAEEA